MLTPVFTTKVNSDYPKMLAIYPDEKHYLTLNNNSNDIFNLHVSITRMVIRLRPVPR